MMRSASETATAIGFSSNTWHPARKQSIAICACSGCGVVMTTTSDLTSANSVR